MGVRSIITIQGYKNSGKSVSGEMLVYCLNMPKFLHNYKMYRLLQPILKYSKSKYHTTLYAEKIKVMIAELLNVDRASLEDRDFKENYFVDFTTLTVAHRDKLDSSKILSDSKFMKEMNRLGYQLTSTYYLSVRQVMQYFGTEIMRFHFGQDIWILSTLKSVYDNLIICDQRFVNEHNKAIANKAKVVHITRPGTKPGVHSSESELEELLNEKMYHHLLENDGTLSDLFDKCKKLAKLLK